MCIDVYMEDKNKFYRHTALLTFILLIAVTAYKLFNL